MMAMMIVFHIVFKSIARIAFSPPFFRFIYFRLMADIVGIVCPSRAGPSIPIQRFIIIINESVHSFIHSFNVPIWYSLQLMDQKSKERKKKKKRKERRKEIDCIRHSLPTIVCIPKCFVCFLCYHLVLPIVPFAPIISMWSHQTPLHTHKHIYQCG